MLSIRINRVDSNIDEVFIYGEDPYVNRAIYAKHGIFTAGEMSEDDVMVLEKKSIAVLADERAKVLAQEAAASQALSETATQQEPQASNEEA